MNIIIPNTNTPAIWSGKEPLPAIGEPVGVPFGLHRVKGTCRAYFTQGEQETYVGLLIDLKELPEQTENSSIGRRLKEKLRESGDSGFAEFIQEDRNLQVGLFGTEICPAPDQDPIWFDQYGLGSLEEFSAVAAIVLGGSEWRSELSSVWMNGNWNHSPFHAFSSPLQRIRNTAFLSYMDHIAKKQRGLVNACKGAIKTYEAESRNARRLATAA